MLFRLAIVALVAALPLLAACGRSDPIASYQEQCAECGMQWKVTLLESGDDGATVEVQVRNTGERGNLQLVFNEVGGYALTDLQAGSWRSDYSVIRSNRNAAPELRSRFGTAVRWRPKKGTQPPAVLQPDQVWKGRYEAEGNAVPKDAAGLILLFGPVNYANSTAGQPASEFWLTWDRNRPFMDLRSAANEPILPDIDR